jgi:hypothetical protein
MYQYLEYNARSDSDQGRSTLECSTELYNEFLGRGGGGWKFCQKKINLEVKILFKAALFLKKLFD